MNQKRTRKRTFDESITHMIQKLLGIPGCSDWWNVHGVFDSDSETEVTDSENERRKRFKYTPMNSMYSPKYDKYAKLKLSGQGPLMSIHDWISSDPESDYVTSYPEFRDVPKVSNNSSSAAPNVIATGDSWTVTDIPPSHSAGSVCSSTSGWHVTIASVADAPGSVPLSVAMATGDSLTGTDIPPSYSAGSVCSSTSGWHVTIASVVDAPSSMPLREVMATDDSWTVTDIPPSHSACT